MKEKENFQEIFFFLDWIFVLNQTHTAETERLARKRKKRMMKMWRKILVFEFSTLSCYEGHDRAAFPPLILSDFIGGKRKAEAKRESIGDCTHVGEHFRNKKSLVASLTRLVPIFCVSLCGEQSEKRTLMSPNAMQCCGLIKRRGKKALVESRISWFKCFYLVNFSGCLHPMKHWD